MGDVHYALVGRSHLINLDKVIHIEYDTEEDRDDGDIHFYFENGKQVIITEVSWKEFIANLTSAQGEKRPPSSVEGTP